jgi:hypothetical protein
MDDLEKDDVVEGCVISSRELKQWMTWRSGKTNEH